VLRSELLLEGNFGAGISAREVEAVTGRGTILFGLSTVVRLGGGGTGFVFRGCSPMVVEDVAGRELIQSGS